MAGFTAPGSVQRAVAKSEIESLLHRYAILARENLPVDQMQPLFLKDGIFRLPNGTEVKPAELGKIVRGKPPEFIRHHITTIDVQFVSDNEAKTHALFFAVTELSSMDHWGCWKDIIKRQPDGQWAIVDRSVIVEGKDPHGLFAQKHKALGDGRTA